jgi:hypothetical protein
MSKSYKNAFYSKCLDIYTSIVYGVDEDGVRGGCGGDGDGVRGGCGGDGVRGGCGGGEEKGDIEARIAIYNKFIDLYALYYKNEEFIISINMDNEALLSWKHKKMHINIESVNNNQEYKCPKYPLYNLTSIKDDEGNPITIKICDINYKILLYLNYKLLLILITLF